jgi:hypothetical protein
VFSPAAAAPAQAEAEWRTLAELSTVEQTPVALSHEV